MTAASRTVAVCGATGRQGGAVTRSLLAAGWKVRALTRDPAKDRARAVAATGADVVRADMEDPASLRSAFEGADAVFSVQSGLLSGFDREVIQGRNVADAAKAEAIGHLVYGSAGTGAMDTGIASWDAKLEVEDHMRRLDLPVTILRPQAFMELMTDKAYYPAVGTWRIWPMLMGDDRPVAWLAVDDLGAIAAHAFARRDEFVGRDIALVSDTPTLAECRALYRDVMGREPATFPMPIWLFDLFTRKDITAIWRWVRTGQFELDSGPTRAILPAALSVKEWLVKVRDELPGREMVGPREG